MEEEEEPAPRPQSPQPGPSGIQQQQSDDDDDEITEERWFSSIDKNVGTMANNQTDYDELKDALATAVTGFMAFVDKFKATATLAYDYKEAYRASRRALRRKRQDCVLVEAEV